MKEQRKVQATTQLPVNFIMAEVIVKSDEYYVVKHEQSSIKVKTASSFLFVPEIHDQVLVVFRNEQAYILQILERVSDSPLTLRSTKPLFLQTSALHCQAELVSLSGQSLHLDHQELHTQSEQVHLQWQQTVYQGQQCHVELDRVRVTTRLCDYVVDTLTMKAKHVLEWIDDLKQQMLGRLHVSVQKNYQLDCESVEIYSQNDVKIDAKQVHLG